MYRPYTGAAAAGLYGVNQGPLYIGQPGPQAPPYAYSGYGVLPGGRDRLPLKPRRRLNVVALAICLFVPWLVFCFGMALMSFKTHYDAPTACLLVAVALLCLLGLAAVLSVVSLCSRKMGALRGGEEVADGDQSWNVFLYVTAIVALLFGIYLGNMNMATNMIEVYDLNSLDTYHGVDPMQMHGQELMDAGQVRFVPGTQLDLQRAMSFKSQDTYCVAPIAGPIVASGQPMPLASYDFWAVGMNCCAGSTAANSVFKCGPYNSTTAKAGLRAVRDVDRSFFRLAVQQAISAYQIKAVHPLFFYWVEDPEEEVLAKKRQGYQFYAIWMVGYFVFQILVLTFGLTLFVGSA